MNFSSIVGRYSPPGILPLVCVSLLAGCANPSGPPVDLPVAKHAPAAKKHGRDTLMVTFTADRKVWVGNQSATNEGLTDRLNKMRKKYESFTTVIRADRNTKTADILALYRRCIVRFEDQCVIFVAGADPAGEYEVPFSSYRSGTHEDLMPMCYLENTTNGFTFNGHPCTNEQFHEALDKAANIDTGLVFKLIADPDDSLQSAVDIMDMCHQSGLARIFLVEKGRE